MPAFDPYDVFFLKKKLTLTGSKGFMILDLDEYVVCGNRYLQAYKTRMICLVS